MSSTDKDILGSLLRITGADPPPAAADSAVSWTTELDRVARLPWRGIGPLPDYTPRFAKSHGTLQLRDGQNELLYEAAQADGLLAGAGVGQGKTLVSLLLPLAMLSRNAVLLIPANLREQLFLRDIPFYSEHFWIPLNNITVVTYEELSDKNKRGILETIGPDLIIGDEAHNLRHKFSVRSTRVQKYALNNPRCRFVFMTGSLASRSIRDYAHLAEMALKRRSPLPKGHMVLQEWSEAIDPPGKDVEPRAAGALARIAPGADPDDARALFHTRFAGTPGVVLTRDGSATAGLLLRAVRPPVPELVLAALEDLRETWTRPDGEEFDSPATFQRYARQLACGFWYRWNWPGGRIDEEWLAARREWNRAVRQRLQHNPTPNVDSPALLAGAADRGDWPEAAPVRTAWLAQATKPEPPKEAVWVDEYLVVFAAYWAADRLEGKAPPGIIWYEHEAVGAALRDAGIPTFGGGPAASTGLLAATPDVHPVIACSVKAHATGKNLQAYAANLVLTPPSNGAIWEQLLGRTHRAGQQADEVEVDVCLHTDELTAAFAAALDNARYIEATTGNLQKLLYATKVL